MNKQEFLEKLRVSLNGKVPAGIVTENLNFYEDYINTEMRKGKSEEEVFNALGDPRLIARTIVETKGIGSEQTSDFREGRSYSGQEQEGYQEFERMPGAVGNWLAKLPGWIWLILFIVIAVMILSAIFHVIAFFAPALIAIAVVLFLVKLFRDWMN